MITTVYHLRTNIHRKVAASKRFLRRHHSFMQRETETSPKRLQEVSHFNITSPDQSVVCRRLTSDSAYIRWRTTPECGYQYQLDTHFRKKMKVFSYVANVPKYGLTTLPYDKFGIDAVNQSETLISTDCKRCRSILCVGVVKPDG
jgi:hypothetical protein